MNTRTVREVELLRQGIDPSTGVAFVQPPRRMCMRDIELAEWQINRAPLAAEELDRDGLLSTWQEDHEGGAYSRLPSSHSIVPNTLHCEVHKTPSPSCSVWSYNVLRVSSLEVCGAAL